LLNLESKQSDRGLDRPSGIKNAFIPPDRQTLRFVQPPYRRDASLSSLRLPPQPAPGFSDPGSINKSRLSFYRKNPGPSTFGFSSLGVPEVRPFSAVKQFDKQRKRQTGRSHRPGPSTCAILSPSGCNVRPANGPLATSFSSWTTQLQQQGDSPGLSDFPPDVVSILAGESKIGW